MAQEFPFTTEPRGYQRRTDSPIDIGAALQDGPQAGKAPAEIRGAKAQAIELGNARSHEGLVGQVEFVSSFGDIEPVRFKRPDYLVAIEAVDIDRE